LSSSGIGPHIFCRTARDRTLPPIPSLSSSFHPHNINSRTITIHSRLLVLSALCFLMSLVWSSFFRLWTLYFGTGPMILFRFEVKVPPIPRAPPAFRLWSAINFLLSLVCGLLFSGLLDSVRQDCACDFITICERVYRPHIPSVARAYLDSICNCTKKFHPYHPRHKFHHFHHHHHILI
jgi:hypothetical protein